MNLEPKIKFDNYETHVRAIDTHTVGEFTRVIIDPPHMEGKTMIERRQYLEKYEDDLRRALMFEPRGHHDMFGSIVCEPVNPEADFGVIFLDTGGYLNMCGHGTIGTTTALIEAGLVEAKEPVTEIVLEAPAGIIRVKADVKDGKVTGVTLQNVPGFLYKENIEATYKGKKVVYDIAFGGSFFAIVDVEKYLGLKVVPENVKEITDFGMWLIDEANEKNEIQHPELDITTVDLAECYCTTDTPGCDLRNVVIFGNRMADRSPCGTGTSAKMSLLHARGELEIGKEFVYESFIGSRFYGKLVGETKVGDFDAVIPTVRGAAYLCGYATYIIDGDDPLKYGFEVPA